MDKFDVAIIGGGPAGSSTAISLLQQGLAVAVIEKSNFDCIRFGETLVPKIREPLMALGAWERFLQDGHRQSNGIQSAWDSLDIFENDFIFNPYGKGWNLDRVRFDAMLLDQAGKAGARIFSGAILPESIDGSGSGWTLRIRVEGGSIELSSRFVVDATGRSATMALKAGAKRFLVDQLVGVAAFFSTPEEASPHRGCTLIEAQKEGWWYSAELPTHKTVVVFMTDADLFAESKNRVPDFWRQCLLGTAYTKTRLHLGNMPAKPHTLAAGTSKIFPVVGSDWLAVGDAAMAYDPLSSQGVYKALSAGRAAAQALAGHLQGKRDSLSSYSEWVEKTFTDYLGYRRSYYQKVRRWPESVFWKRRWGPTFEIAKEVG